MYKEKFYPPPSAYRIPLQTSPKPSLTKIYPTPSTLQTPPKPSTSEIQPKASPPFPRIAFIIDDLGNDYLTAKPFLDLPYPIAVAILPLLRHSKTIAKYAEGCNKVVLLHLPVESVSKNQLLGPGALFTSMDENSQKQIIEEDLKSIPGALGINNHLGSKGTRDPLTTENIAYEAKIHHLFIVDSLTIPDSILYDKAKKLGVPAGRRDVFLDNSEREPDIESQIRELQRLARKNGKAIGIGHPYPETLKALRNVLPQFIQEGIQVVPITQLVQDKS